MLYIWFSLYNSLQKNLSQEEIALISYVIFFLLTIVIVFVIFFSVFQKRKNQLLIDKIEQQQKFDEELVKTQQEIQEETLKHVGRELHDNVGQLLAVATMQLNAAAKVVNDDVKSKVDSASEALKDSLTEVRALSKSLNSDVIFNLGFDTTVKNELERLEKSGLINTDLKIKGEKAHFENKKDEIILFRILQEFFSNTLKYAEAETLNVVLDYRENALEVTVNDNGKGFDVDAIAKGSGLVNMEKRAELISAKFGLQSNNVNGTSLNITYPFKIN
jgi:signal transduction histidine kinase